jgi:hypothetical protein
MIGNKHYSILFISHIIQEVNKWELRNWIENGNEGIFGMRIYRDVYKGKFRNP